jgi:hypothetical protein
MATISNHRVGQSPLRDHSAKTVSPPALVSKFQLLSVSKFQLLPPMLLPLNRDYNPIIVTPHEAPEMVVVGEWISTID